MIKEKSFLAIIFALSFLQANARDIAISAVAMGVPVETIKRMTPPVIVANCAAPRRKVIIDQDAFGPGGPNLQPILMVLQSPEIEVLGITVESGDGWQKENVAHTLRMLELIGRPEIPVVPGATYPLLNTEEGTRRWEKLCRQACLQRRVDAQLAGL